MRALRAGGQAHSIVAARILPEWRHAKKTLIIEDSVPGVLAGVSAGCRVVGFTGASHTFAGHGDQLMEAGADTVISRLSDLPAVVDAFADWDGV